MKKFTLRSMACAAVLGFPLVATTPAQADVEWEETTNEYEDDAWYDVTEWFDGNDYNKVGENAFDDGDNDWGPRNVVDQDQSFGYDNRSDTDDWFYDYYDDHYLTSYDYDDSGTFEFTEAFYDTDEDGLYDAGYGLYDSDGDGLYDYATYVTYNDASDGQTRDQAKQDSRSLSDSKKVSVSGEVASIKRVNTPHGQNLIAHVKSQNGQKQIVDLGPAENLDKLDPEQGDQLKAEGMRTQVGDKSIVLSSKATIGETTEQIERTRRSFTGTIQDLKTAQINGTTRQLAIIETSGKNRLVDMGPKNELKARVATGNVATVRGPMVKINDQVVVMCQKCTIDGETTTIDRRSAEAQKKANAKSNNSSNKQKQGSKS